MPKPLSLREIEVLQLVAEGKSNEEIGSQLYISVNTVKKHLCHIISKLGAKNRAHAVVLASIQGLIEPGGADRIERMINFSCIDCGRRAKFIFKGSSYCKRCYGFHKKESS